MKNKIFKLLAGLAIIGILQYTSIWIVGILHTKFPPALIGMMMLSILLYLEVIPMQFMKDSCSLLLNNMMLFFVPLTVGVTLYSDVISKNLIVLMVVIAVSTLITLIVTALTADYFVERKLRKMRNE